MKVAGRIHEALPQSRAWPGLKAEVQRQYPEAHAIRLENYAGAGTPDCNLAIPGEGEIWVELKYRYDKPNELQLLWQERRRRAGGRVALLTFNPGRVIVAGKSRFNLRDYPTTWGDLLSDILEVTSYE